MARRQRIASLEIGIWYCYFLDASHVLSCCRSSCVAWGEGELRFITWAITAAVATATPLAALQAGPITDRNAGFSIDFPGEAKREKHRLEELRADVTLWEQHDSPNKMNFQFYVLEYPSGWRSKDARRHAAEFAADALQGSQILTRKDTTVGARGGHEATARFVPDSMAASHGVRPKLQHVRVLTSGNRVYVAFASHPESEPPSRARTFLSSLRVLK